jgi:hypothetical protein
MKNPLTGEELSLLKHNFGDLRIITLLKKVKDIRAIYPNLPALIRAEKRQKFGILSWFKNNFPSIKTLFNDDDYAPDQDSDPTIQDMSNENLFDVDPAFSPRESVEDFLNGIDDPSDFSSESI